MKGSVMERRLERAGNEDWDDATLAGEAVSLAEEILVAARKGQRPGKPPG